MKTEFTTIEYVLAIIKLGVLSGMLILMAGLLINEYRKFKP
jgi:hypothetical protein